MFKFILQTCDVEVCNLHLGIVTVVNIDLMI